MSRSPSKSKSDSTFLSSPSGSSVACLTVWLVSLSCFKSLPGSSHLSARITNLDMKTEKYTSIHTEKTHIQYKFNNQMICILTCFEFEFSNDNFDILFRSGLHLSSFDQLPSKKCHKQLSNALPFCHLKHVHTIIILKTLIWSLSHCGQRILYTAAKIKHNEQWTATEDWQFD